MKMYIGLIVRLFGAFILILMAAPFVIQKFYLSPSIEHSEIFDMRITDKGYFPVNEQGHVSGIRFLSVEERLKLLKMIKSRNPEIDAAKSLKEKDYRFISSAKYGSGTIIGYFCNYTNHERFKHTDKYVLVVGEEQTEPYEDELKWVWLEYGRKYNYKIFHGAPAEAVSKCRPFDY